MPASTLASVIPERRLLRSGRTVLALLTLVLPRGLVAQTSSVELPPPVTISTLDRLLDAPPFHRHLWGIALTGDRGTLEYARNADRLFILASNTKLVVAGAASTLLDPALRVATGVYASGPVRNGVVQGDLILYGRGDPTMSRRCYDTDTTRAGVCDRDPLDRFRDLANRLAQLGITAVEGDLVGDGSWFQGPLVHPTWETADLTWWYAAPVTGLGFNDNSVDVTASPTTPGAPATITLYPELPEIVLDNQTRTGVRGDSLTFDLHWDPAPGQHFPRVAPAGSTPRSTTPIDSPPSPSGQRSRSGASRYAETPVPPSIPSPPRRPASRHPSPKRGPGPSPTGFSRSSTPARTGSPRCSCGSSTGRRGAREPGPEDSPSNAGGSSIRSVSTPPPSPSGTPPDSRPPTS